MQRNLGKRKKFEYRVTFLTAEQIYIVEEVFVMSKLSHSSENEDGKLNQGHPFDKHKIQDDPVDNLADWLERLDYDNFDQAELDRLLEEAENICPSAPVDADASYEDFKKRFSTLFEEGEENTEIVTKAVSCHKPRRLSRLIIPIAAALAIMMGSLITAQAMGIDVFGAIAQWTSEIFQFAGNEITALPSGQWPDEGENINYSSLDEAFASLEITQTLAPSWIPPGFETDEIYARMLAGELRIYARYINDDENVIIMTFDQRLHGGFSTIQKDDTEVIIANYGGNEHFIMSNLDNNTVAWLNSEWECIISGALSIEDIDKIIASIYD